MDASLAVAIGVTFGALLLLVGVTFTNTNQLLEEGRWVGHTKDVLAAVDAVQAAVAEAESGQRGFLLTQDVRDLEPYRDAAGSIAVKLNALDELVKDSPQQRSRVRALRVLVGDRLGQLDLVVRLVSEGRADEGRAYARAGAGRATMDRLRAIAREIEADENALLEARAARSSATARTLRTTLAIGGALLFAFLVLIWWLIRTDLARRNRSEAAIRERETRIRRLVDANLVGVAFSADGGITDANDAFLAIVGLERLSFVSGAHQLFAFTAPEFRELDENCEKELRETGSCRPYQKELVRPDGSRVPVLFGATVLETSSGEPQRASFVVDLSELKRVETERNHLYEEARDAVKARDAFLSVAGHEIRTPLSALHLLFYQLSRHVRALGNEKAVDLAARCEAQLTRLIRLADELLDVSRISAAQLHLSPEEMDLAQLARDVVERFEENARRAGSSIELRTAGPVDGFWDRLRLDQVLSNLLTNALKFGAGEPIVVNVGTQNGRAQLSVADRGIGIGDEDQRRIFERFQRGSAADRYPGMGLGLWITREIVEAHGGRISVESRPGAGATFRVALPRRLDGDVPA